MFYNGATRDARWRIGWISFDPTFTRVTDRGIEPVILPPPASDRSAPDIAFAASAVVEDGCILLYIPSRIACCDVRASGAIPEALSRSATRHRVCAVVAIGLR